MAALALALRFVPYSDDRAAASTCSGRLLWG